MRHYFHRFAIAVSVLIATACAGDNADTSAAGDTAAPAATTPVAHNMADMNRPAAKDADHEFLRGMIDHHEGMIQMGTAAMTQGSTQQVKDDAHKMHTNELAEQKQMQAIVSANYGEEVMPMVMASNKTMIDALQQRSGTEYDRTFYQNVIQHHRDGIQMMNDFEGRVQRADVKRMITRMKADKQREIQELETKVARLR